MFHVKHSLLLQKLAGGQVNIIDMQKLLITGFRGIGDGERIAYDERSILLGNAVAAVDVADRGLFLRGWVNRILRIGNDGLRKLIKDGVRRRRRVVPDLLPDLKRLAAKTEFSSGDRDAGRQRNRALRKECFPNRLFHGKGNTA